MCLIFFRSSSFLQVCPFAPLFASSSAASFPLSLLCPFMCSNLISLFFLTCRTSVPALAARYLLLSAVYSPFATCATYVESLYRATGFFVFSCSSIHFRPSHIAVSSPLLLLRYSAPRKYCESCFVSTGPKSPVVSSRPFSVLFSWLCSLIMVIPHPAGQFFWLTLLFSGHHPSV